MRAITLNKNELTVPLEWVRKNRAASRASETKRALLKNWGLFEEWCQKQGVSPLPVSNQVLEEFLIYLADIHPVRNQSGKVSRGMRPSSVAQALWAINAIHRFKELPSPSDNPCIKTALAGIRRRKGVHKKQQEPLTLKHLELTICSSNYKPSLRNKRNKSMLLVGFVGCFRRSELVALRTEHIKTTPYGLQLFLPHSKTDQESAGAWVDIIKAKKRPHLCPVLALREWIDSVGLKQGPLFCRIRGENPLPQALSPAFVDSLVKKIAKQAGENPSQFGGHSLRAGGATYLVEQQKSPFVIAKHGRWKKLNSVLQYARHSTAEAIADVF